ncbi:shikimate kinase [Marinibaculum pumilum]|uniref:Shikimate kinase n=1 Tax=Marinibaculum pumilum TaxID=1766165 RepID=A0ABV7KXA6_9PROT
MDGDGRAAGGSLVLVGLMGSGKSTIGRRLANRLGMRFVDADDEIEKAAGCSISDIFATMGEAAFRDGERRVIARLLAEGPLVLATGGGAFMDETTRDRIRDAGTSIWLRAGLEVLVRRCQRRTHRPLLQQGNPRDVLRDLMARRHPLYETADVTVDSGDEDHETVVDRIIAALAARGTAAGAAGRVDADGVDSEPRGVGGRDGGTDHAG